MRENSKGIQLKYMLIQMVKVWAKKPLKIIWNTRALQLGMIKARLRRKQMMREEGLLVPMGIGLSPTMRCNLSCVGCYARFHPRDGEMSIELIERVVSSAIDAGVFLFVITGGEPFLRSEMMNIYKKNRSALFMTVTNGTLIDNDTVSDMVKSGNILPIVSIEGTSEQTDKRRGDGVYQKVMRCMSSLKDAGVLFGFSAVLTRSTISTLVSTDFIHEMINAGCTVGVYNDFIPLDSEDMRSVPDDNQRRMFKDNLNRLREKEPIVLLHLPDDEYDVAGRCMAVGDGGMHINAQGYVEPCPFAHFALENVKNHSFKEILRSPFLEAIRKHPTVLQHGKIGCSLVNNHNILKEIAKSTGAESTYINGK